MDRGALAGLALAGLLALASAAARADMGDALRAYDGGDYDAAFAEFRRLAGAGDPVAPALTPERLAILRARLKVWRPRTEP